MGFFWLRVGALVAGSMLVLGFSILSSVIHGKTFFSALAISIGLVATLQAGYILGLLAHSLARSAVRGRKHIYNPPNKNLTFTKSIRPE
jgi:hypothetical protein